MNGFLFWLWFVPAFIASGFLGAASVYFPWWYIEDKRHGHEHWYRDWRRSTGPKRTWFK